ncbi:hypothetical protein F2981_10410 [Sinorhizobium meliloti]|nr:hypothetical protein [Sinorhizobium meliloti]
MHGRGPRRLRGIGRRSFGLDRNRAVAKTSDGLSDAIAVRDLVTAADISQDRTIPGQMQIPAAPASSAAPEDHASGMRCRASHDPALLRGHCQVRWQHLQLGNGEWYLTSFGPRS